MSSGKGAISMGQFSVPASGLKTLVRSTGVAAQEAQESLTTQQYNEVIFALDVVYLTALNGIARATQSCQSSRVESETVPPVLPIELFCTSQCDLIALVRNHKKRLLIASNRKTTV